MSITYPPEIGVMALPSVTLFPGGMVPLHIFEPRYRRMLASALEGHRMFGLAQVDNSGEVSEIGGIGVVRACVTNFDGTSNLMLQGTARVRFTYWRREPYPIAGIEEIPEIEPGEEEARRLRHEIIHRCQEMRMAGYELPPQFDRYIADINSHGAFCDIVASIVITDAEARQRLLEEFNIGERMASLLDWMNEDTDGV